MSATLEHIKKKDWLDREQTAALISEYLEKIQPGTLASWASKNSKKKDGPKHKVWGRKAFYHIEEVMGYIRREQTP